LFTKFAGGKLLVRTHQGLILLRKIASGKLLVRTHQGLILLHKIAGGKLLVRTHQGWILLHKIGWKTTWKNSSSIFFSKSFLVENKLVKNSTSKLN
jgi:hypothetical protein